MKIGILTLHFSRNFGAVLQCASLFRFLQELGHDPIVIDYDRLHAGKRNRVLRNFGKQLYKCTVKTCVGRAMDDEFEAARSELFKQSRVCETLDELKSEVESLDAIVVGSDQVWNLSYGFVDSAYFLPEKIDFQGLRLSYAACCGHPLFDADRLSCFEVPSSLKRFDALLVRNQTTKDWVEAVSGCSSEIVCDPTLLLDEDFSKELPSKIETGYILVSTIGAEIPGGLSAAIREVRKSLGDIPVVKVSTKPWKFERDDFQGMVYREAGPREWLGLIKNAEFVITDSFHASIFCAKYQVPFVVYWAEEERKFRLKAMAADLGLKGVVVSSVEDGVSQGSWSPLICWDSVRKRMVALRSASVSILKSCLESVAVS